MISPMSDPKRKPDDRTDASSAEEAASPRADRDQPAREIGGRDGPDPVRYGDWEKGGRCIDF